MRNLAQGLSENDVRILGTSIESINLTEDRSKFSRLLDKLNIPCIQGITVTNVQDLINIAKQIDFKMLIALLLLSGGVGW